MLQRLSETFGDFPVGDDATENVLPALGWWRSQGTRAALATLVGIDGASPRALGTQLAVSADGRSVGSLSSGCLEAAIRGEARTALRTGASRVLRYGKQSPFIDIVLPCGSGLDVHVAPVADADWLEEALDRDRRRLPFAVLMDLDQGESRMAPIAGPEAVRPSAFAAPRLFRRTYAPPLRLAIVGEGAAADLLTRLCDGLGIEVWRADAPADLGALDAWSAIVLLLHDHDREAPWLEAALATEGFYIGAVGSGRTQAMRLDAMAARGHGAAALARIRGPIGRIERAKSPRDLAVSVLAEVLGLARADPRFGA